MTIVMAGGATGAWDGDSALDTLLRSVAVMASQDDREWANKYGTNRDTAAFMMHKFCWCMKDDCPWCGGGPHESRLDGRAAPNFWHKPSGLRVHWYKYIGRGVEVSGVPAVTEEFVAQVYQDCLAALAE